MISNFMGTGGAATKNAAANKRESWIRRQLGQLLGGLTGGGKGQKSNKAAESAVAASAGEGASSGLPTCADDGTVTMTFRQVSPQKLTRVSVALMESI